MGLYEIMYVKFKNEVTYCKNYKINPQIQIFH